MSKYERETTQVGDVIDATNHAEAARRSLVVIVNVSQTENSTFSKTKPRLRGVWISPWATFKPGTTGHDFSWTLPKFEGELTEQESVNYALAMMGMLDE